MCCMYLLMVFTCSPARAQSAQEQNRYVPTPQTWAFMRYGNTPVDYYTGTARVDVPLCTYADNDFELRLTAGYASTGFQPQRQTGILGLNWFLSCGGSITREIRGHADDMTYGCGGFIVDSDIKVDDKALFELQEIALSESRDRFVARGVETESDVYHFNFMGHAGTFHFNGRREVCVYDTGGNHGTYEITFHRSPNDTPSHFTIRTADGYQYTFGGDNNAVERYVEGNFICEGQFKISKTDALCPVVTWNLREIVAPNGRKVTFTYKEATLHNENDPIRLDTDNPFYVTSIAIGSNEILEGGTLRNHMRRASVVRTSYLDRIDVGDCNVAILFGYGRKGCCDVDKTPPSDTMAETTEKDAAIAQDLYRLDNIEVVSGKNVVRRCSFSYRNKDYRTLLTGICLDESERYRFDYYEDKPFAGLTSPDVDFWGYQNNDKDSFYNRYCPMIADSDCNENIDPKQTFNDPDWTYALSGCLRRITYPTKGYTEFRYEANRAQYIVLRRDKILVADDVPYPIVVPEGTHVTAQTPYLARLHAYKSYFHGRDETGGVRIRSIIDYDGAGAPVIREFEYGTGIVMSFPRYKLVFGNKLQYANPYLNIQASTFDRVHIGYSSVRERRQDGSYTEYRYNDYLLHPDEPDDQCSRMFEIRASGDFPPDFIDNIMREPNSRHYRRGKLRSVGHYDASSRLVRMERMKYSEHNAGEQVDYSTYVVLSGNRAHSVKRFTGDYRLTEKSTADYFGRDSLVTTTRYSYNDLGQISATTVIAPDKSVRRTNIVYRHQSAPGAENACRILDHPASVVASYAGSLHAGAAAQYITSATAYDYADKDGVPRLRRIRHAQLDEPAVSARLPLLGYTTDVEYVDYDKRGNPTQIRDAAGVTTCYIWGYGGRYPVLRAAGTTYAALKNVLGITDDMPLAGGLSAAQETDIRNMEGIHADTYDYLPDVGMTRHTDAAGRTYTYRYDTCGRLIRTDDPMGQLQEYQYVFTPDYTISR